MHHVVYVRTLLLCVMLCSSLDIVACYCNMQVVHHAACLSCTSFVKQASDALRGDTVVVIAGPMAAPARALRAALKEAAGKLLSQLYDRNCRRQFVPLEAFQTDSLPPERFRVEMQTAAAAAGGLMQATNTRVWGLLRSVHFSLASTFCSCQMTPVRLSHKHT